MRIVLDTNVLVSALLNRSGAPAQVLTFVLSGEVVILLDDRILSEYREVLFRPRFAFDPQDCAEVLGEVERQGERISAARSAVKLPDDSDRPFLEVALSGGADALVTGNSKHFPKDSGVLVLTPRELLARLD